MKPMTEQTRARLVKLLGMLGSSHEGEVAAAARHAVKLLKDLDATWGDLIAPITTSFASYPDTFRQGDDSYWGDIYTMARAKADAVAAAAAAARAHPQRMDPQNPNYRAAQESFWKAYCRGPVPEDLDAAMKPFKSAFETVWAQTNETIERARQEREKAAQATWDAAFGGDEGNANSNRY